MSGTSLDGVDAAAIETDGVTVAAFGPSLTLPYPAALARDLRHLLDRAPHLDAADPFLLDVTDRVTALHAQAVTALGWPAALIGFHGQTILHRPQARRTWQIGDAHALAAATGTRVAHDFRSADVASGGQGAPFAPLYHAALAATLPKPVAVLNLGGVANVTLLTEAGISAADIGPGNGPLDDLVSRHAEETCDRDGRYSAAGTPDPEVLAHLLADPFLTRPWPKSLDRLDFTSRIAASGLDRLDLATGAATLVAFIAGAAALVRPRPRTWLVCGGGRHNPSIMAALRRDLAVDVRPVEAAGWNGDALEAQCFAFLAARVARHLPLSLPATTGVPRPMHGGRLTEPPK
jgi:anhydro-N-acetylmuramic acid kinase